MCKSIPPQHVNKVPVPMLPSRVGEPRLLQRENQRLERSIREEGLTLATHCVGEAPRYRSAAGCQR